MTKTVDPLPTVMPEATPSDADIAAWQALPRDEQLHRLRAKLANPDCATVSTATMGDILSRAQGAVKLRHGCV